MDLSSNNKFTAEINRVIEELEFLRSGDTTTKWEDDKERLMSDIMHGSWYDGLECLLKSAIKMKTLLLHVKELNVSNGETKRKFSDPLASQVEEEVKTKEVVAEFEDKVADRKVDSRKKGRERNVMVFIEDFCSESYYEEIEAALNYLDCDKGQLKEVEIVRDRVEPEDKIVLRLRMNSTEAVASILDAASKLKSYYGPKMYMAKDLNYVERQRLRKLVRILREKIDKEPENYWKIVNGEVRIVGTMRKKVLHGKRSKLRESIEQEVEEQVSDSESEDERCAVKWF
jgi:hypothetical protein